MRISSNSTAARSSSTAAPTRPAACRAWGEPPAVEAPDRPGRPHACARRSRRRSHRSARALRGRPRGRTGRLNPGTVASAWADRIARAHVPRRAVSAGMRLRVGDATIAVLAPDGDPRVDVPSLVLRLERGAVLDVVHGRRDRAGAGRSSPQPGSLPSRVYVPPHHGAASAYAVPLVEAVRPSAAVISVGAQNRYGHPTPETLAALGKVPTYRTDRDGTVELDQSGSAQLVVRTHANGLPAPRGGSLPHAPPAR